MWSKLQAMLFRTTNEGYAKLTEGAGRWIDGVVGELETSLSAEMAKDIADIIDKQTIPLFKKLEADLVSPNVVANVTVDAWKKDSKKHLQTTKNRETDQEEKKRAVKALGTQLNTSAEKKPIQVLRQQFTNMNPVDAMKAVADKKMEGLTGMNKKRLLALIYTPTAELVATDQELSRLQSLDVS